MGVYIRGMEMPKNCWECHFGHGDSGACVVDFKQHGDWDEPKNCPLVHIPPHGRLVDMGEIEERIDSCCNDIDCSKTMCNECAVPIVMNKVFDTPTIIPVEEV